MRNLIYRLKIGTKVSLLAALGVALSLGVTGVAHHSIGKLRASNQLVANQGKASTAAADVQAQVNTVQVCLNAIRPCRRRWPSRSWTGSRRCSARSARTCS